MVHMPLVERIGLDNSIPIGLRLWAVCGIVSHVLALETLDVTQVLWCLAILTVASIASIASPILHCSFHCHCHSCYHCGGCVHYGCDPSHHDGCVLHCEHGHSHHCGYVHGYVLHCHHKNCVSSDAVQSYTCHHCCCTSSCCSQWPAACLPTQ